ncbi:MAG: hypothetical protein A3E87_00195 [Gammaproteobacteria bacterium RIFCSPHIGHO2_12_FULL_35_23]|nr:MAG: hypothetical protein A3E87_00195 [Gammaproteobacteria bacterium RIFCSPHIGHO2_12_FULL_35_23]
MPGGCLELGKLLSSKTRSKTPDRLTSNFLWEDFKAITVSAWFMWLSFSFSIAIAALGPLLTHLPKEPQEDALSEGQDEVGITHTDTASSAALTQTTVNTILVACFSVLYALVISASDTKGEYDKLMEAFARGEDLGDSVEEPVIITETEAARLTDLAHEIQEPATGALDAEAAIRLRRKRATAKKIAAKRQELTDINAVGMVTATAASIPATLAIYSAPFLLKRVNPSFVIVYCAIGLPLNLRMAWEQIIFSFRDQRPAMLMSLPNLGIGLGLAYWLGYGGGIKRLGPKGVAAGLVIEELLTAMCYGLYLARNNKYAPFKVFNFKGTTWASLKHLFWDTFYNGSSIAWTMINEMAISFVNCLIVGAISKSDLAKFNNAVQLILFMLLGIYAFGFSAQIQLGNRLGYLIQACANNSINIEDYSKSSQLVKHSLLATTLNIAPISLITMIVFLITSKEWFMLFIAIGIIADALRVTALTLLRQLGDVHSANAISTICLWAGVAMSALFGLATNLGIEGPALGFMLGYVLAAAILVPRVLARSTPVQLERIVLNPPRPISWSKWVCSFWNRETEDSEGLGRGLLEASGDEEGLAEHSAGGTMGGDIRGSAGYKGAAAGAAAGTRAAAAAAAAIRFGRPLPGMVRASEVYHDDGKGGPLQVVVDGAPAVDGGGVSSITAAPTS